MTRIRLAPPVDAAVLHLERLLSPARRGLVPLSLASAETAEIGDLPAAARVSLTLGPDRALIRRLDLPAGTDIRRAIPLWLEDNAPWAPGNYLWDAAQAGRGDPWQVALVPSAPLRQLEDRLERCGSLLAEVRIQAQDGTAFLLRPDLAGRASLRRALLAFVGGVAAFGIALALWQGQSALAARDIAATARAETARLQDSGPMGAATSAALALQQDRDRRPDLAARLGFLAARLPADTWLLHLGLEGDRFTLSGRSTTPEAIIPALSTPDPETPVLTRQVDFDGPMARDIQNGLFSFTVTGIFTPKEATE